MAATPQIVAAGGGGFTMEEDLALDAYALAQSGRPRPRVLFLAGASGDAPEYVAHFLACYARLPCAPGHLPEGGDPARLDEADVIVVGGGNTKRLLDGLRASGLDRALAAAWRRGVVLSGVSAGALCWFSGGVSDYVPGTFSPLAALGLLPPSFCPHWDSEPGRQPVYRDLVGRGRLAAGFACDDGVALHFHGDALHAAVASRAGARAIRLARRGGAVVEEAIAPRKLKPILY